VCTTGAEALYSDMGHWGENIQLVGFCKTAILNYFGQAAF
jgi:K+ transporter